jgi:hypothetical protein
MYPTRPIPPRPRDDYEGSVPCSERPPDVASTLAEASDGLGRCHDLADAILDHLTGPRPIPGGAELKQLPGGLLGRLGDHRQGVLSLAGTLIEIAARLGCDTPKDCLPARHAG